MCLYTHMCLHTPHTHVASTFVHSTHIHTSCMNSYTHKYAKWNKTDRKQYMLYDSICIKFLERQNHGDRKNTSCVGVEWEGAVLGHSCKCSPHFIQIQGVLEMVLCVGQSTCYFCRRPGFGAQNPHQVVHLYLSVTPVPGASTDLCMNMVYTQTNRHTRRHIN